MLVQAAAAAMAGRAGKLHGVEGEVTHTASGRKLSYGALAIAASSADAAEGRAAQGPEGFRLYRQAAEAARYAGQGQRQGRLRHRRDAAGHEVRDASPPARCSAARSARSTTAPRRRFPACARSSCSTIMVAVVGDHMWAAKKGLDALKIDWNEGPNAKLSSKDIWAASARGQRKGRRGRQIRRRHRQGACRPATSSRRHSSCRSSRTRRWSR